MNELEFNSIKELRIRLIPALKSKVSELRRKNIDYVSENDIFEYLALNKWMNSSNLSLETIVDDILNTDSEIFMNYVLENIKLPKRKNEINE